MALYGKGHIQDVYDPRDYRLTRLLTARGGILPDAVDMTRYVDHVRDQGVTSSCVGQAFSRAIHIRAGALGYPTKYPSALAIYTLARFSKTQPLLDIGCYPRDAANVMRTHGVCAEEAWPLDSSAINEHVPWDVLQRSSDGIVRNFYKTGQTYGSERCELIRRALASYYPVPFATQVDNAFEDYSSGTIGVRKGDSKGGHMLCLIGYRPGAFLGINSWGRNWGIDGYFWISDERIGSSDCSDFYAIETSPYQVY